MEHPSEDAARPEGEPHTEPADAGAAPTLPPTPTGPEAAALAREAEEIRRMVEAGAGTPEAIRDLAARLREHRAREEALWRAQVKPALVKEGKGRLRGHGSTPGASSAPAANATANATSNALVLGLIVLGLVLVVVVAASTSAWVLIVPVVGLLLWAWQQGRRPSG